MQKGENLKCPICRSNGFPGPPEGVEWGLLSSIRKEYWRRCIKEKDLEILSWLKNTKSEEVIEDAKG